MRLPRPPVLAASAAVLGLTIGGALVAVASAATTPDPINACITKTSGAVRIVASSDQCKKGEAPLSWNLQGQPGAPGTNGTNGVSGYEIVVKDTSFTGGVFAGVGVDCPAGKSVLGGGVSAVDEDGKDQATSALTIDASNAKADGSGWFAGIETRSGFNVTVRVRAQCATVTP